MTEKMKNEFGNTNSKEIWKNELLCAQFLRSYSQVPLFRDVRPEDIEDITESLRPFVGVEYEGDTVKQVRLHGMEDREVFVVGLLEHKSDVDYDVSFQLLKYMVGIWALYQKGAEKGDSRNKNFRYPLIIPIVYYEGKERWTASTHWQDRVEFSEEFGQYVPDFTYEVVELRQYSNEELLSKEEELSLVMALNRVQTEADLNFAEWPEEQRQTVEKILRGAPKDVLRILAQMIHHFGLKMNLPDRELTQYIKNVEDRDMGELWANMDKIDIQEIRRKAKEEVEEAKKAAEKAAKEAEKKAKKKARKAEKKKFTRELAQKDRIIAQLRAENERLRNSQ